MKQWRSVMACLVLALPVLAQQAGEDLPTLRLDDDIYVGAVALGQRLAIKVEWQSGQHAAKLSAGDKWLSLSANTILARGPEGRILLPTCPVERNSALYVPATPVVTLLGGSATRDGDRLELKLGEAVLTLTAPAAGAPADRQAALGAALADPRVPVVRMGTGYTAVNTLRWGLDQFVAVTGPLQPLLAGVGRSRILGLLSHIPVVGGFVTTAQDAVGAVGEVTGLVGKLAAFDDQQGAPLRRAVGETAKLLERPDLATAAGAVPAWQGAVGALDERIKLLDQAKLALSGLQMALYLLDVKGQELTVSVAGSKYKIPFVLGPARSITDELKAQVQGARWDAAEQRRYYQRLIAIAETKPATPEQPPATVPQTAEPPQIKG